ncbi:hypothetical protein TNCV_2194861 [Trichonephila clavipes]|uniref:Uncharacterized protein n=1 Tax=Trichonephila clavipes TaxID=2585209 RepID=A0A8X6SGB6_TRICX|nr:hypothetical protein TNCV_2194861 [Trichonephila clavipes]
MPPIPSEYTRSTCSLNQWVRSLMGLVTSAGTGECFPPLQFDAEIVKVEIGSVAIYRPFGEFHRAKSYCHPVWCSRPTTGVLLAPCHDEFRGPRFDYVRQWH